MRNYLALALVPLTLGPAPPAEGPRDLSAAVRLLQDARPGVHWDSKTGVVADVTCDGTPDTIFIGYEKKDAVWVGVVPGLKGKGASTPITFRFGIGHGSQDSFCASPVRIETQPIYCDTDAVGHLPGCKVIAGCRAVTIPDEDCDSFHVYWDDSSKKLQWWRP